MFMLQRWFESLIIGLLVGTVAYFLFGSFGYERTIGVWANDCIFTLIGCFTTNLFLFLYF